MHIMNLFPVGIGEASLTRELTSEERVFIDSQRENVDSNIGNITSSNKYILDSSELSGLKKDLEDAVKIYFYNTWNPVNREITPFITMSWLTWTKRGEYHHSHCHPNSIISGTYYVDAGDDDNITFLDPLERNKHMEILPEEFNMWNSVSWKMPTPKNTMKLFPSWLKHQVEVKDNDNVRCCLAFNTWLKGTIGDFENITELKL